MKVKFFLLFMFFCAAESKAASFDCNKASTKNEKIICSDSELSELDSQMAKVYRDALKNASDEGQHLKIEQKVWLGQIKVSAETASDRAEYLKSSYRDRIIEIKNILSDKRDVVSDDGNISFLVATFQECAKPTIFISTGKLDTGKNEVGVYKKFIDEKHIISLGEYQESSIKEDTIVQSLIEQGIDVKINVAICPKSKDENGITYAKDGALANISFKRSK